MRTTSDISTSPSQLASPHTVTVTSTFVVVVVTGSVVVVVEVEVVVSAVVVVDDRIEAQEAMLRDPTGPSQLYTAGDGKFVVFRLDNIKCMKYNFYSAPQEIK